MKHQTLMLLAAVLAALPLSAHTTWTGAAGDGKWGTPANWSNGVPTGAQNEKTTFSGSATVQVDGENSYYLLVVSGTASEVVLTGSGTINLLDGSSGSGRGVTVDAGCTLVIDGPTLQGWSYQQYGTVVVKGGTLTTSSKGMYIYDDARLVMDGGFLGALGNNMYVTNGASVIVKGGTVATGKLYVYDGSSVTLCGGELFESGGLYRIGSGALEFLGGTYRFDLAAMPLDSDLFLAALPPRHGRLAVDGTSDGRILTASGRSYGIDGEIFTTNCNLTIYGYQDTANTASFTGDFDLTLNQLRHVAMKSGNKIEMYLNSLTLGAGGITQLTRAGNLYFMGGTRFGAFADWSVDTIETSTYHLYGEVEYDTLDALDRTTPRAITLRRHNLSKMTGLKVYGGGTVTFDAPLATPSYLSHLSVTEGSTLSFSGGKARFRANEMTVPAGSVLELQPYTTNHCLDAVASASLGAGSVKIGTSSPDPLPARCPVYFAPATVDPDLAIFDISSLPAGYTLAKTGNTVYLTDGTPIVHDVSAASATGLFWTGVEDNNLNSAANWTPAGPNNSGSNTAFFDGWSNMTANITSTLRFSYINVKPSCGPLKIVPSSSSIYIRINETGNITSESAYPVILGCKVGKSQGAGNMNVLSTGTGYIALTGGANYATKDKLNAGIRFAGDIRIGGEWTAASVAPHNTDSVLPSQLTLLQGANLTVTNQSAVQSRAGSYVVSQGATFTVGGTSTAFAFSSENENVVNGAMTVNCPFSATATQTFRGRGTLTLASVSDGTGGIKIADSLTLVPGAWGETPLSVRDTPTIAPAADWTFAPGGDITLEIAAHSTLTIDTGAHNVTLSAPLTGEGNLVKAGTGNLIFNATGNVIDTLTVQEGGIAFGTALSAQMGEGWTPFLTAWAVNGDLALPAGFELTLATNDDGSVTYSARRPKGLSVILR